MNVASTSAATPSSTAPRASVHSSIPGATTEPFATVLSGSSSAPASTTSGRDASSSSRQDSRRPERHQSRPLLASQSPQQLTTSIAPVAASPLLPASSWLASPMPSGPDGSAATANASLPLADEFLSSGGAGPSNQPSPVLAGSSDDLSGACGSLPAAAPPQIPILESSPLSGNDAPNPETSVPPTKPSLPLTKPGLPPTNPDAPSPQPIPAPATPASIDPSLVAMSLPLQAEIPAVSTTSTPFYPHVSATASTATEQAVAQGQPAKRSASSVMESAGKSGLHSQQTLPSPGNPIAESVQKSSSDSAERAPRWAIKDSDSNGPGNTPASSDISAAAPPPVIFAVDSLGSVANQGAVSAASNPGSATLLTAHVQPALDSPGLTSAVSSQSAQATDAAGPLSKIDVARLVRSASGSELRVGVHSEEFGAMTISAALGRERLSAHITTESERLGSALSTHLSSMQSSLDERFGKGLNLQTTVSVGTTPAPSASGGNAGYQSTPSHGASSSPGNNSSGGQQRHHSYRFLQSASGPAQPNSSMLPSMGTASDRLSIRI